MNNIRTEPYLKDGTVDDVAQLARIVTRKALPIFLWHFVKDFAMLVVLLSIAIAVFCCCPDIQLHC